MAAWCLREWAIEKGEGIVDSWRFDQSKGGILGGVVFMLKIFA